MRGLTVNAIPGTEATGPVTWTLIHGINFGTFNAADQVDPTDTRMAAGTSVPTDLIQNNLDICRAFFDNSATSAPTEARFSPSGDDPDGRFSSYVWTQLADVDRGTVCIVLTAGKKYLIDGMNGHNAAMSAGIRGNAKFRVLNGTGLDGATTLEVNNSTALADAGNNLWAGIRTDQWFSGANWLARSPSAAEMVEVTVADYSTTGSGGTNLDKNGVRIQWSHGNAAGGANYWRLNYVRVYEEQ